MAKEDTDPHRDARNAPHRGDAALAESLRDKLRTELFAKTAPDFIEAKLAERAERHRKQGGQRYVVEPNVKEGKGGLRDLQSLYWIGKYVYNVREASELVQKGVFRPDEYDTFARAENFLWAVRCHLHLISRPRDGPAHLRHAGRGRGAHGLRGSRRPPRGRGFMQDYFRHATRVGELTRIFLTAQEANHVKSEPMLQRLLTRKPKAPRALRDQAEPPHRRRRRPSSSPTSAHMLRIFEEALRTATLLHPDAMRLLAANLRLIDARLRDSPEANQIFLDLLLNHGNPERALRRMNELGVLAAFIPDFEPIVAMMQFNMYHHFTVDEHIIQCISHLARIERGAGRGTARRLFDPAGGRQSPRALHRAAPP